MEVLASAGVDARILRTRIQLRRAALHLASTDPIGSITVADLTREAGINRATFYKHADSPLQVLESALVEDLDGMRANFLSDAANPATDFTELWREAAHGTAAHVAKFAPIYQQGFSVTADGILQSLLSRHITNSMATLFRAQPNLLPEAPVGSSDFYIDAYASALGHGLTAVLRVWLNSENSDVEEYTSAVLNTLPVWMLMSGATGGSPQGSVLNVSSRELESN
jgi:AcrR family transcriptional regulator